MSECPFALINVLIGENVMKHLYYSCNCIQKKILASKSLILIFAICTNYSVSSRDKYFGIEEKNIEY